MTADALVSRHTSAWQAATVHPFLAASVGEQAREAEDAFFWVTHYERGFWDMAMSG